MMYIDHHIQRHIVDQLRQSHHTFSELHPADIENSLFMYHLRKLIARGIVEKIDKMYQLTPAGSRWAHRRDRLYQREEGLRCLVQLFIVRDGRLLISERIGPTAEHMNKYLLPGALHSFGHTSEESATWLANHLNVSGVEPLTHLETIITAQAVHVLIDVYSATRAHDELPADEPGYHYYWANLDTLAKYTSEEAGALPTLVQKYLDGSLRSRELFTA